MLGLFAFAADVGASLAWLIPTLCYVSGTWAIISGLLGMVKRSGKENGFLTVGAVPELFIVGGSVLLAFPQFLNVGNRTLGGGANTSIGAGGAGEVSFDQQQLQAALQQGPMATLTTFLHAFDLYFMGYGALVVYLAIMRFLGRAKGTNHSSVGGNMIMLVSGFIVMNADVVAPAVAKELGLS